MLIIDFLKGKPGSFMQNFVFLSTNDQKVWSCPNNLEEELQTERVPDKNDDDLLLLLQNSKNVSEEMFSPSMPTIAIDRYAVKYLTRNNYMTPVSS